MYGDSEYNCRPYLKITFQGAHLSNVQRAFNESMSSVRDGEVDVQKIEAILEHSRLQKEIVHK